MSCINNNPNLELRVKSRELICLKNSHLARTRNMNFFNDKVELYKRIDVLEKEVRALGGVIVE